MFDGLGRLVAGGATPDGKVVDGTGALVGTIGVDCACIKSVTTDGAFYTYTIDPTPGDDADTVYDRQAILPAAQEVRVTAAQQTEQNTETAAAAQSTEAADSYEEAEREEVVAYALSLVGTPYVWGGESASGLDCSGLIRCVYRNTLGISLLHYTDYQAASGKAVSISSLQPGDICCYDWKKNGHIDHVGIYIGGGKVVEAGSESGKVDHLQRCDRGLRANLWEQQTGRDGNLASAAFYCPQERPPKQKCGELFRKISSSPDLFPASSLCRIC